jgi:hypothetical protein
MTLACTQIAGIDIRTGLEYGSGRAGPRRLTTAAEAHLADPVTAPVTVLAAVRGILPEASDALSAAELPRPTAGGMDADRDPDSAQPVIAAPVSSAASAIIRSGFLTQRITGSRSPVRRGAVRCVF